MPSDYTTNATSHFRLGFCQCGCGARTKISDHTNVTRGHVKGQPFRFVHGHNGRRPIRYVVEDRNYESPCWIWQLGTNAQGYGYAWNGDAQVRAHRMYWEERNGPIPEGLQLDHRCRVRSCVNPDHLKPVTPAENTQRGNCTKLTPDQIRLIRATDEKQWIVAQRFGITQSQVSRIKNNHTWRNIE